MVNAVNTSADIAATNILVMLFPEGFRRAVVDALLMRSDATGTEEGVIQVISYFRRSSTGVRVLALGGDGPNHARGFVDRFQVSGSGHLMVRRGQVACCSVVLPLVRVRVPLGNNSTAVVET